MKNMIVKGVFPFTSKLVKENFRRLQEKFYIYYWSLLGGNVMGYKS